MKLSEIRNNFDVENIDIDINLLEILENKHFNKNINNLNDIDYKEEALKEALNRKKEFSSTSSSIKNIMSWVSIRCPDCGKNIKNIHSGGNSEIDTFNFKCSCGRIIDMSISYNAFSIRKK